MAATMTLEDHRRGFAAAISVLLAEFDAYLDSGTADPATDGVGYRQGVIWLNPEELAELGKTMQGALARIAANRPGRDESPICSARSCSPARTAPHSRVLGDEHGPP